jgi:hypothetical protein
MLYLQYALKTIFMTSKTFFLLSLDGTPLFASRSLVRVYAFLKAGIPVEYQPTFKSYWHFYRKLKKTSKVGAVLPYSPPYYIYALKLA